MAPAIELLRQRVRAIDKALQVLPMGSGLDLFPDDPPSFVDRQNRLKEERHAFIVALHILGDEDAQ